MKIVHINTFPYKATGTIMMNIHNSLLESGIDSYAVWGRGRKPENDHEILMGNDLDVKLHGIYTRLTDKTGFASASSTNKLIVRLKEIKPDIIHLHNIHGYYLNIERLFNYIRANNQKVVWTFHDCWPFTGHCAYFDAVGCDLWKTGCQKCPQKKTYPSSVFADNSNWNWKKKKKLFTGLDITIVTPCKWLKELVNKSFFRDYDVKVIYNGINLDVFIPSESNFKEKYGIVNKKIVLGVASEWTPRKGLNDFITLSEKLSDEYKIVLVGLTQKQINSLPQKIIGLERTSDAEELAGLYSQSEVFFNPTYEDNFPTTNMEAIACGTHVLTYKTGGSPESVSVESGAIIEKGDIDGAVNYIIQEHDKIPEGYALRFGMDKMIGSYRKLYESIVDE